MVRKGRRHRGDGGGGIGGIRAPFHPGGLLGAAILGFGAAAVAKRFAPGLLGGWTGAAAGFAMAGLPGAVAGWFHDGTSIGGAQQNAVAYSSSPAY